MRLCTSFISWEDTLQRHTPQPGPEALAPPLGPTFALWRVLAAVPEDVDLIDRSVGLKQLLQLLLRPGARDLAHKHLDGVRVGLVGVLQRPVHLPGRAVAVEGTKIKKVKKVLQQRFNNLDHQSKRASIRSTNG